MQETSPGSSASKSEWRRWLRGVLAEIDDTDEQSKRIRDHLAEFLRSRPNGRIASFAALPGEPFLLPLIDSFPDHQWALPRVQGENLDFHQVGILQTHQSGAYGIAEPSPELPLVSKEDIDLFLCPGIGFTPRGGRLGRGKGFYDRALASSNPDSIFIGVAFREQVVSDLPMDTHDIRMSYLVSPDGVSEC